MSLAAILVIVGVVVIAAVAVLFGLRQRSLRLQRRFGPEYGRAVEESGNKYKAEAKLERLEKEVKSFDIHPLGRDERTRYLTEWRGVQARFVDNPKLALQEADDIVRRVMHGCGYPLTGFETQAAQLSVDHPLVVQNYRFGHGVALRQVRGEASTEEVRRGLIAYRTLFEDLVGEPVIASAAAVGRKA